MSKTISTITNSSQTLSLNSNTYIIQTSSTLTLPSIASINGAEIIIINASSGNVTVNAGGTDTISGGNIIILPLGTLSLISSSGTWYARQSQLSINSIISPTYKVIPYSSGTVPITISLITSPLPGAIIGQSNNTPTLITSTPSNDPLLDGFSFYVPYNCTISQFNITGYLNSNISTTAGSNALLSFEILRSPQVTSGSLGASYNSLSPQCLVQIQFSKGTVVGTISNSTLNSLISLNAGDRIALRALNTVSGLNFTYSLFVSGSLVII